MDIVEKIIHWGFVMLLVASVVLAQPAPVLAQDDSFTEITYYQGKLLKNYLPYATQFFIKGSTQLVNGDADIVHVITTLERSSAVPDTSVWMRLGDDSASEFKVLIPALYNVGGTYDFTFSFLKRATLNERILKVAIEKAQGLITEVIKDEHIITISHANEILRKEVNASLGVSSDPSKLRYLDGTTVRIGLPIFQFLQIELDLLQAGAISVQITAEEVRLKKGKEALARVTPAAFDSLFAQLENAGFPQADVDLLKTARTTPEQAPTAQVYFRILGNASGKIDSSSAALLTNLGPSFLLINSSLEGIDTLKTQQAELASPERLNQQLAQLTATIGDFFVEQSKAHLKKVAFPGEAKLEELRIGTTYGFAGTYLSPGGGGQANALSYAGLKIHFGPVDKSLPEQYAYPSWKSRLSFTVGLVFDSEVTYEGQVQENLFSNMMPMLGISWDLDRFLGFNVGALFFRQPSTNPLAAAQRNSVESAPYFGITFDFNVINRLSKLMTN